MTPVEDKVAILDAGTQFAKVCVCMCTRACFCVYRGGRVVICIYVTR